eukprot:SAG11_NODE_285_length_11230_cov_6.339412_13_plen_281_part_00
MQVATTVPATPTAMLRQLPVTPANASAAARCECRLQDTSSLGNPRSSPGRHTGLHRLHSVWRRFTASSGPPPNPAHELLFRASAATAEFQISGKLERKMGLQGRDSSGADGAGSERAEWTVGDDITDGEGRERAAGGGWPRSPSPTPSVMSSCSYTANAPNSPCFSGARSRAVHRSIRSTVRSAGSVGAAVRPPVLVLSGWAGGRVAPAVQKRRRWRARTATARVATGRSATTLLRWKAVAQRRSLQAPFRLVGPPRICSGATPPVHLRRPLLCVYLKVW